jgi:hypothetical protein
MNLAAKPWPLRFFIENRACVAVQICPSHKYILTLAEVALRPSLQRRYSWREHLLSWDEPPDALPFSPHGGWKPHGPAGWKPALRFRGASREQRPADSEQRTAKVVTSIQPIIVLPFSTGSVVSLSEKGVS